MMRLWLARCPVVGLDSGAKGLAACDEKGKRHRGESCSIGALRPARDAPRSRGRDNATFTSTFSSNISSNISSKISSASPHNQRNRDFLSHSQESMATLSLVCSVYNMDPIELAVD